MPSKDEYLTQLRNHAIRRRFYQLLRENVPRMNAYIRVGNEFFLSDERVRKIVSGKE